MYSLEQLKIFAEVCACGSFSAAARKLGRAQSGISQAVANLEIELNQTLLIREKAGIRLTEQGRTLLPEIERILQQTQFFEQKLTALSRYEEHCLSIAIEEGLWSVELLNCFSRLAETFPHTQVEMIISSTFDIEQLVGSGTVQLGIVYKDFNIKKNADFFFLGYSRFITVASPAHPLATMQAIRPETLIRYRHLAHRSISGQELWFSRSFSQNIWYTNDHQTLRQLALTGIGWADLPEKMAANELAQGSLVKLDLDFEPDGNLITVIALQSHAHPQGRVSNYLLEQLKMFFA
ncbi:LysR family transcriptional regulator [Pasteurellaceae bacterium LIM206]|nr:LysR family transcriptional regulator [Pasteurellaceae bacterium LIM206]